MSNNLENKITKSLKDMISYYWLHSDLAIQIDEMKINNSIPFSKKITPEELVELMARKIAEDINV